VLFRSHEYIFRDLRQLKDQPISGAAAYNIIREIIVGIFPGSKLSPHSFRKGFIEQALNRKNDLISIANATGHASIEMIKYYDTRDASVRASDARISPESPRLPVQASAASCNCAMRSRVPSIP